MQRNLDKINSLISMLKHQAMNLQSDYEILYADYKKSLYIVSSVEIEIQNNKEYLAAITDMSSDNNIEIYRNVSSYIKYLFKNLESERKKCKQIEDKIADILAEKDNLIIEEKGYTLLLEKYNKYINYQSLKKLDNEIDELWLISGINYEQ